MSKLINKYIIILIGFYVFWLGIFPQIAVKSFLVVCKNLSHNTNYKIEVVNPKIRTDILPVMRIYADKISVASKKDVFSANVENFKVKFRLLPLLSGKLHINSLRMNSADLSADLKQEVELDKDFFNRLDNTKIIFDSVSVESFNALLRQRDTREPIIYSGKNFLFKKKNRYLAFKVNSILNMDNTKSTADVNLYLPKNNNLDRTIFDVEVNNLNISPFRIYFKHYLPKDLKELRGIINIDADKNTLRMEFKNCAGIMEDSAKSVILPENLLIKSVFKINQHSIKLESTDINSKNISAYLEGKILDYLGKAKPSFDLSLRINKSKVEDFVKLLPPFTVEDLDAYKLKKYNFYGDVLANITIKGRMPEPDINGNIYISSGILTKPIPNASSGATIKIKLTGRYANFDVNVPAGKAEKVTVNGGVELYNVKYADIYVKSTQNVSLPVAESVVNPLHEILNFVIGPVPILHVPEGTGNIDINVKGNRKNPHVWGGLNFYNASVYFKDMPDLELKNADAELTFNDQNAFFTTKRGLVNGKDFKISGTCDLNGKFDFDAVSQNQPVANMYRALQTAVLIPDIQKMLPVLDKSDGLMDLAVKVYGTVKFIEDLKFGENTFAKGKIDLKNDKFSVQGIDVENTNGNITFDNTNAEADIRASILNTQMSVKAKIKNDIADLLLDIPKFNPNSFIPDKNTKEKQYLPFISVFAKYKGNVKTVEFDKLNFNAKILESNPKSNVKFNSGEISAVDNKLQIKSLSGYIDNPANNFYMDLKIANAFSKKPETSGTVKLKTPDITIFNEFLHMGIIPKNVKQILDKYELKQGKADINCKITNNKINMDSDLSNLSFLYMPIDLPFQIINGNLSIRNNTLKLNKINMLADNMPILADGEIKDIFGKPNFNIYINSKPKQEFIDKYINKNQLYPLKIKGDIVYWAKLKGAYDNYDIKTQFDLSKDSSVYYLGAMIGDVENAISLYIDSKIYGNNIKVNDFTYDKIIDSLSGRRTKFNLLKVNGGVELLKDDLGFKDLHIKTSQPTDARIFNIIFRKPNIKQGQFTSDLKINNKMSNPRVLGQFKLVETNIPFIDVTVKNIELLFKDRIVEIASQGDVMGNAVKFDGVMTNKLKAPYHIEKATLYTKDLDLNRVTMKLKTSEVEVQNDITSHDNFDMRIFTAQNFRLKADSIELRNINAEDFDALFSLNDKGLFDVHNFDFKIAQGNLKGTYKYNFGNNDMKISLEAENINANDITLALFDLKNQIYGDLTGNLNLSCCGTDFHRCMSTLSGNAIFKVKDGRMPKLGSLEYLLKAGNLVKGGITSLSINSIIDLITPMKTGEFSEIYGTITMHDGFADDIEITTKGKDLSLFISGTYNFAEENADMEVLGLLSRKISTMFGPVGNLSINTLFNVIPGIDLSKDSPVLEKVNKIPGVELSNKAYRKFLATIKGNINGDNYVTNFSWIN